MLILINCNATILIAIPVAPIPKPGIIPDDGATIKYVIGILNIKNILDIKTYSFVFSIAIKSTEVICPRD